MQTLPNGVTVFNSTPHPITFWDESWEEPISVAVDKRIDADPTEKVVRKKGTYSLVKTVFVATRDGWEVIHDVPEGVVIIGSIIAAQAYKGFVCAMVPAPGFERVPPDQKRMRPDRFTVF
jgi:hypothetical protein